MILAGISEKVQYRAGTNEYAIDRTFFGDTSSNAGFVIWLRAPRAASERSFHLDFLIDHSSLELFRDKGMALMSALFFRDQLLAGTRLHSPGSYTIQTLWFSP
ncbi:MAG: hypothetical protein EOO14_24600 [Chitinophagaceae bacterium]|nr:MAG: hypothetical protein EOO14_24600 [Chitinophagaceae bacterium]